MTIREVDISAAPIDAFEAAIEVLEPAVTEGAFKVLVDESPRHYAIGWATLLTGARYDFRFERERDVTWVVAELEFSGAMGPLLRLIRGAGNGPHLEKILGDVKKLAEAEEFYEDDDSDLEENDTDDKDDTDD